MHALKISPPRDAQIFFLSDAISVKRRRTPFRMTHTTEVGVGRGLFAALTLMVLGAGVAAGIWQLGAHIFRMLTTG